MYCHNLNYRPVRYSDHRHWSNSWMVCYSNGDLNSRKILFFRLLLYLEPGIWITDDLNTQLLVIGYLINYKDHWDSGLFTCLLLSSKCCVFRSALGYSTYMECCIFRSALRCSIYTEILYHDKNCFGCFNIQLIICSTLCGRHKRVVQINIIKLFKQ